MSRPHSHSQGRHHPSMQKYDRTTGNTRYSSSHCPPAAAAPPPSWETVTLVFRLEWSRQPGRGASHPHRAGDRREEGAPLHLPATAASAGHARRARAAICQTLQDIRAPLEVRERDGGLHNLVVWLRPDDSSLPGNG